VFLIKPLWKVNHLGYIGALFKKSGPSFFMTGTPGLSGKSVKWKVFLAICFRFLQCLQGLSKQGPEEQEKEESDSHGSASYPHTP
jgi:hypothetical protein